jgi:hypothetical protein
MGNEKTPWNLFNKLNGQVYEKADGEHYAQDSIASPRVNIITFVLRLTMQGNALFVDFN